MKNMRGAEIFRLSEIFASPVIRPHCRRRGNSVVFVTDEAKRDYFLWLLTRLTNPDRAEICGLHNLIDELERQTRDTRGRDRISPWVSAVDSPWTSTILAFISEIQWTINRHRPKPVYEALPDYMEKIFKYRTPLPRRIQSLFDEMDLSTLATPLTKFDYPSREPRSEMATEKKRRAESSLDAFWASGWMTTS